VESKQGKLVLGFGIWLGIRSSGSQCQGHVNVVGLHRILKYTERFRKVYAVHRCIMYIVGEIALFLFFFLQSNVDSYVRWHFFLSSNVR